MSPIKQDFKKSAVPYSISGENVGQEPRNLDANKTLFIFPPIP